MGPPPSAPDNGLFNSDLPAYGDNQTRNYLTHIFNKCVLERINNYPNISFITLFYDLIDSNLETKIGALHDGCHMDVGLQPIAKQAINRMLSDDTKATLNHIVYKSMPKYKRIFKKVSKLSETPYINFYKNISSKTLEYFSYSPGEHISQNILGAAIDQI